MAPEEPGAQRKRRSALGVAAYLLVPGERRRRAAGHFGRAAIETVRGVRALAVPSGRDLAGSHDAGSNEGTGGEPGEAGPRSSGARQRIEID